MEVGTALHAIRNRWLAIALITAAVAAMAGSSFVQPPTTRRRRRSAFVHVAGKRRHTRWPMSQYILTG